MLYRGSMLSFNQFLVEENSRKVLDILMSNYGYGRPAVGADGHITYTSKEDSTDQYLMDLPGKEWHHMSKGKVTIKGSLEDNSLEKHLS